MENKNQKNISIEGVKNIISVNCSQDGACPVYKIAGNIPGVLTNTDGNDVKLTINKALVSEKTEYFYIPHKIADVMKFICDNCQHRPKTK